MINSISIGSETLVVTASTTLGYGPGQIAPPRMLLCNASGNINIALPTIPPVLPTPPGTPGTSPGTGDGLLLTVRNLTSNNVTVTAGGSDTVADKVFLNGKGATANLCAVLSLGYWYNLVSPLGAAGFRGMNTNDTVATTDRYVNATTAGTVTLLAPTSYPSNALFVNVINSSNNSVTVTPASGNINTTASYTLATLKSIGVLTNGTDFFLTNTA